MAGRRTTESPDRNRQPGPAWAPFVALAVLSLIPGAAGASSLEATISHLERSERVQQLQRLWEETEDPALLSQQAETLLFWAAAQAEHSPATASLYLVAAARAWQFLEQQSPPSPERHRALSIYNRAVAGYVQNLFDAGQRLANHYRDTPYDTFVIEVDAKSQDFALEEIDEIHSSPGQSSSRFRRRYRRDGAGAALTLVQHPTEDELLRFFPGGGAYRPATAVLTFDPPNAGSTIVRGHLRILDPQRREALEIFGQTMPLAADFTAPLETLARHLDGSSGFFHPERQDVRSRIYMLESYDPEKIPLLMVHGLRSTPHAWLEMTNDLLGDDGLRDRYQIWHFDYPTGLPFLHAAYRLRNELGELATALGRHGKSLPSRRMVVIGHSMGGLLAKSLAVDSGDRLWQTVFEEEPSGLSGPQEDIEQVRQVLRLESSPWVGRLLFVATPHRGSGLADSFLGKLGSTLAGRARSVAGLWKRLATANPETVKPELEERLRKGGWTSVQALSPDDPLLRSFAELDVDPDVPYHSIIGDRRGDPSRPQGDGIVPYDSAHLDRAASERIVASGHAVYENPEAIAEVRRILRQHLQADVDHRPTDTPLTVANLYP